MQIEEALYLDYNDVLIRPKPAKYVSRSMVQLTRDFEMLHPMGIDYSCVPVMAANMDHTGTEEMLVAMAKHNAPTVLHKHHSIEDMKRIFDVYPEVIYYGWWSIGMGGGDLAKLREYTAWMHSSNTSPNICIDVANGYTYQFADYVKRVRSMFPNSRIMAGNVATPEAVQRLLIQGADIVKIGIGPGSVCITRTETGVGVPQLTAVMQCADAAHGMGGLVCADGGCTTPGDVAKAFGAGADFVMLGGMLAGHNECDGSYVLDDGSVIDRPETMDIHGQLNITGMEFYGMASEEAQDKYTDGVPKYGTAEGKSVIVPYRGPVSTTISRILGGLRGSMSMVGARKLKDMSKCTTFLRVNNQVNQVFTGN